LADMGGFRLICEGSANLRTNSNLENLLFCREDSSTEGSLHDWHSLWIDSMVAKHEHTTDRQAGAPA
jgi:hypothetical protein